MQDIKWASQFSAEYFDVAASDFNHEIDATLQVSGRGQEDDSPGRGMFQGVGAGHATVGGSCKL